MVWGLIASAAGGIAQSWADYFIGADAADHQLGAFNAQVEYAYELADLENRGLRRRQAEERAAAGAEIQAIMLQALGQRSAVGAAAAEAGVGGASLRAILRDFTASELNRIYGVESNLARRDQAIEDRLAGSRLSLEASVFQGFSSVAPTPSILLPIFGAGLSVGQAQAQAPEGTFLGIGAGESTEGGGGEE